MAVVGPPGAAGAGGEDPGRDPGVELEAAGEERDRALGGGDDEKVVVEVGPEHAAAGGVGHGLHRLRVGADQREGAVGDAAARLPPVGAGLEELAEAEGEVVAGVARRHVAGGLDVAPGAFDVELDDALGRGGYFGQCGPELGLRAVAEAAMPTDRADETRHPETSRPLRAGSIRRRRTML